MTISIAEKLKEASSISEVADKLSISRPTLYKYMDLYDRGITDPIPAEVISYFEYVGKRYDRLIGDSDDTIRARREMFVSDVRGKKIPDAASSRWSDSVVPMMVVNDGTGAVVFFRDAVSEGWDAAVRLFITVGGTDSEIGRFEAGKNSGFVKLPTLPSSAKYSIIAEMRHGSEVRTSQPCRINLTGVF